MKLVPSVRSRSSGRRNRAATPDNSASGSGVKRCRVCVSSLRGTKETIHNGLAIIRQRYGLPYCELPDCEASQLSRFLSFLLLQGKERTSVAFPRRVGMNGLQRLCRRERWELAHSVNSLKRNLPAGCKRHTPSARSAWEANVLSNPPPISEDFLTFVRERVESLFPSGWDRDYARYVGEHLPNPTAREPLKSRADRIWSGRRGEYFDLALRGLVPERLTARYKEVLSAGKVRPLLIYSEYIDLLAPLHRMIYDHLTRTDWLLVGPPTPKRISSVCVGDYQTSVDLVNATDGLSHLVTDTILDSVFRCSQWLPDGLLSLAKQSYRPGFRAASGEMVYVAHGQMMGGYLSFPLLCLHSYCAASFAARDCRSPRILVNGDDAVISAERAITVQDYPSGYRLNDDKTIRARNVVEVNSTTFLKQGGKWGEVRHLRRGGAPTDFPGILHMALAVRKAGPRFVDAFWRARIGRHWGMLPSQLGHSTYVSFLREAGLLRHRYPTALPEQSDPSDEEGLRRIRGRDPTPVEAEVLRSFFWSNGRRGALKRDVFSPSCGKVRRTYRYHSGLRSYLTFESWWRAVAAECPSLFVGERDPGKIYRRAVRKSRPRFFLVPDEFETEEEREGLVELENWASRFDSSGVILPEYSTADL